MEQNDQKQMVELFFGGLVALCEQLHKKPGLLTKTTAINEIRFEGVDYQLTIQLNPNKNNWLEPGKVIETQVTDIILN